jgi:hypothetical protein
LLADAERDWMQPRAGAAGQNDSLEDHRVFLSLRWLLHYPQSDQLQDLPSESARADPTESDPNAPSDPFHQTFRRSSPRATAHPKNRDLRS